MNGSQDMWRIDFCIIFCIFEVTLAVDLVYALLKSNDFKEIKHWIENNNYLLLSKTQKSVQSSAGKWLHKWQGRKRHLMSDGALLHMKCSSQWEKTVSDWIERNPFIGLVYDSDNWYPPAKLYLPLQLNGSEVLLVLPEECSLWRGDAAVEFQLFWEACCMMTEHRLNICRYSSAPSARHLSTTWSTDKTQA